MSTRTLFLSFSTLFLLAFGVLPYISGYSNGADPPKKESPATKTLAEFLNLAGDEPGSGTKNPERKLKNEDADPYEPGREIGISTPKKPLAKPMPPAIAEILRIRESQGSVLSGSILEDGGEGPSFSEVLQLASDSSSNVEPIPAKPDYPYYTTRGPRDFFAPPTGHAVGPRPTYYQPAGNFTPIHPSYRNPTTTPTTNPYGDPRATYPQSYPGRPAQSTPAVQAARPRVAYVPQTVQLPPSAWSQTPCYVGPNSGQSELIQSLRNSARFLEKQAHSFENVGQYDEADKLCTLAHRLRKQVRQVQAQLSQQTSPRYGFRSQSYQSTPIRPPIQSQPPSLKRDKPNDRNEDLSEKQNRLQRLFILQNEILLKKKAETQLKVMRIELAHKSNSCSNASLFPKPKSKN